MLALTFWAGPTAAAQLVDSIGEPVEATFVQCFDGQAWREVLADDEIKGGETCQVLVAGLEPLLLTVGESGLLQLPELNVLPLLIVDRQGLEPIERGSLAWPASEEPADGGEPTLIRWEAENGALDIAYLEAKKVEIIAPGYRPESIRLRADSTSRQTVLLQPVSGLKIELDPPLDGELKLADENGISPYRTYRSVCDSYEISKGRLTIDELPTDVIHVGAVLVPDYEPLIVRFDQLPFVLEAELEPGLGASGTVVDQDGAPLSSAVASIEGQLRMLDDLMYQQEAKTDAEGRFLMTGLVPGLARIKACAAGYTCVTEEIEIVEGEPIAPFSFKLEPGFDLELTVVDQRGKPPLPIYVASKTWRLMADESGKVVIPGVKKGDRLELEIFGRYFVQIKPTIVVDGPRQQIVVEDGARFFWPIILEEEITDDDFWGRWRNTNEKGLRLGSGWCRLEHETKTVVANGLKPGSYQVEVRIKGYAPLISEKLELSEGGEIWFQAAVPDRGSSVVGRVYDDETFEPVVGAKVACELGSPNAYRPPKEADDIASCQTDADGLFRLIGLDDRACRIRIEAPGYATRVVDGVAPTVEGTDLGDLELGKGLKIWGVVTDRSGTPQPDVRVTLWEDAPYAYTPHGATATDAEGEYSLELVPPGTWEVRGKLASKRATAEVTGEQGDSIRADLRLGATRVEGMIVVGEEPGTAGTLILNPPGNENAGWLVYRFRDFNDVYIFGMPKQPFRGSVQSDGSFAVENVKPGSYVAYYTPDNGAYGASVDLEVPSTSIHRCTLSYPNGKIQGVAIDEDGEPVYGVRIDVLDLGHVVNGYTERDGTFKFSGLADGIVRLGAKHGSFVPVDPVEVEIENGVATAPVVIEMQRQDGVEVRLHLESLSSAVSGAPALLIGAAAERTGFADAGGVVLWDSVKEGRYRVCGRAFGGAMGCSEPFQLDGTDSHEERLFLEAGSDIILVLPSDEAGIEPVVRLLLADGTDISTLAFLGNPVRVTNGVSVLGPYLPGSYQLQISMNGRVWHERAELGAGEVFEIDLAAD